MDGYVDGRGRRDSHAQPRNAPRLGLAVRVPRHDRHPRAWHTVKVMDAHVAVGRIGGEPLAAGAALDLVTALCPAELAEVFAVPMLVVDLADAQAEQVRELADRRPPLVLVGVGDLAEPSVRSAASGLDVLTSEIAGTVTGTGTVAARAQTQAPAQMQALPGESLTRARRWRGLSERSRRIRSRR